MKNNPLVFDLNSLKDQFIESRIQGTDGIRGQVCHKIDDYSLNPISTLVNDGLLTEEFFELYTYAYCQELLEEDFANESDLIVIGWDSRDLSGRFNEAAVRGVRKSGLTAVVVDILPTPAISLYQMHIKAACAFVITASHNPADQNGVKIFLGHSNLKLFPEDEKRLTQRCLNLKMEDIRNSPLLGEIRDDKIAARETFYAFMLDSNNHWLCKGSIDKVTIIVDVANGAFSPIISKLLANFKTNFVITNCDPNEGINNRCGVADFEGLDFIKAEEIIDGIFNSYKTLELILKKGRENNLNQFKRSELVIGFVFDGDGDRCFLLAYEPDRDEILVLGGDVQAFFQGHFLIKNSMCHDRSLFVNTVESDLEVGRAAKRAGFVTEQCSVGDKWILWEAFFYDWKAKQKFYEANIASPEFKDLTDQTNIKLLKMVDNSKFDALSATFIILSVEKWVHKNFGEILIKQANNFASEFQSSFYAIGSEESGHLVTLSKMEISGYQSPVFIGNSLKCAFNSLAAILRLSESKNIQEVFKWLKNPFPSGIQKSLPVYYVDKTLLFEGTDQRKKLKKKLSEFKWNDMEVEIVKRHEEPEMILQKVIKNGSLMATVFIRNSGTEDKLSLYLRGVKELSKKLEELAENLYPFLFKVFKNKENPMALAEGVVLSNLKDGAKPKSHLMTDNISEIKLSRLLHEMSSRQKLIIKKGELWNITKWGLACIENNKIENN